MERTKYIIYIVEDSKIIAEILKKVVTSLPEVDARYFLTGEEMLRAFDVRVPDMILLDYYLTNNKQNNEENALGVNGDVIFNAIKSRSSEIPVAMVTGISKESQIEELKNKGYCCVIRKNDEDVYDAVIDCINKFLIDK